MKPAPLLMILVSLSASADDAALEVCRAKLKLAQKLEVLTDLQ